MTRRATGRTDARRPSRNGSAKARKAPSLAVIGAGAVGSTLTLLLAGAGYRVRSVISRQGPSAVDLARRVSCPKASTMLADLDPAAEIVLIAVRDGDLAEVVRGLSRNRELAFRNRVVLHTSGVHTAEALAPLRKRGAAAASFHPLQTFPAGTARRRAGLRGVWFAVDGDPRALEAAGRIAADLGGRLLPVAKELRPLYHAAAVFASGGLAAAMNAVAGLATAAGISAPWPAVFGPLMTATMENTVRTSPAAALTGPAVRGDVETVRLHLEALSGHAPEFLALYAVISLDAARIAAARERISSERFEEILAACRAAARTTKRPSRR